MSKNTILLFYGLFSDDQSYDWAPYGLLYLAAKLKEKNFNPIIIHEYTNRNYEEIIAKYAKDTLAFGVSAMTNYQIISGIKAIKLFKKYNSNAQVVWGGAHATADPKSILQSEYADYAIIGPGINNFIDLVQNISENKIEIDIPYIYDKQHLHLITENVPRVSVKDSIYDLTNFPEFPFDLIEYDKLLTENRVLNYTGSFGCPNNCHFCSWGGFHLWNGLSTNRVIEDITYLVKKYNLRSLWFSDATLCYKRDFLLEIAEGILKNNLNIYWRGNASFLDLKNLSYDDFALLERSGFDRFFVGVENTSQNILKAMNKRIDPDLCTEIFDTLKDFKIEIMTSMIFENPSENIEDIEINRKYIDKWMKINPNYRFQSCFFIPYPGTKMTKFVESLGYRSPVTLEEYGLSPYFQVATRSKIEKADWHSEEFSQIYKDKFNKLFPDFNNYSAPNWNWRDNA